MGDGDDTITMSGSYNMIGNILYGEKGNDTYNISFTTSTTYISQNTVYDSAGDSDSIKINQYKTSLSFYVNVFKDKTYDNDLIIYNNYDDKLTVQNYLTDGKIETIQSSDNYKINYNSLNSIIAEVGTWLSTRTYADVQAVIDSGNTTDISAVISKFTTAWVK